MGLFQSSPWSKIALSNTDLWQFNPSERHLIPLGRSRKQLRVSREPDGEHALENFQNTVSVLSIPSNSHNAV
jgi:hypothetical protein